MLGIGIGIGLMGNPAASSGGGGGGATAWGTQADWDIVGAQATRNRIGTFWGLLHASAAKTNGTAIFTINAIGPAVVHIGFDSGTEANALGADNTGASVSYSSDGGLAYCGGSVATVATYTTGDVIKEVKSGNNVSFYKNNVQQGPTIDLTSGTYGASNPCNGNVYPSVDSFHQTGAQITADFTGW